MPHQLAARLARKPAFDKRRGPAIICVRTSSARWARSASHVRRGASPALRYQKPDRLDDALGLLAEGSWRLLAGGTDFYPAQGAVPIRDDILDINGLSELRGVSRTAGGIRIGARTTWTDIARADLPPALDALRQAAREIGGIQIQNTGTIAGNLCNASPAADAVPALMAVDAEVELSSMEGARRLSVPEFILGNRRTARRADELLTAIHLPSEALAGSSSFFKLGARRYLVISIAMAAARIVLRDSRIVEAAIAIGACSEVAKRLTSLEAALVGCHAAIVDECFEARHFDGIVPIDDVRATAVYRHAAAREITLRAVKDALAAAATPMSEAAA